MKVGDDMGRQYRRRFLKWDPIKDKYDRYEWILLFITVCYIGGHLVYAYFTL
jgi:hypothetical protein